MSEDITYCLNNDCKKKKCERHASHIKNKAIPHSFAMFDCPAEKPRKWAISRPKNGISLEGECMNICIIEDDEEDGDTNDQP